MHSDTIRRYFAKLVEEKRIDEIFVQLAQFFERADLGIRTEHDSLTRWIDDLLQSAARTRFGRVAPTSLDVGTTLYVLNDAAALPLLNRLTHVLAPGRSIVVVTTPGASCPQFAGVGDMGDVQTEVMLQGTPLERTAALLVEHDKWRPGRTFILGPHSDVVALGAASVQPAEHNWALLHHPLQGQMFGASLETLVHIDTDASRHRVCMAQQVRNQRYVPLPIETFAPRTEFNWPPVMATLGRPEQFVDPESPQAYVEFLRTVLSRVRAYFHFGDIDSRLASAIRKRLSKFDNFHVVSHIETVERAFAHTAFDLYFEPLVSSDPENALSAMARGLPVVHRSGPAVRGAGLISLPTAGTITWDTPDSLSSAFGSLNAGRLRELGQQGWAFVEAHHNPTLVAESLSTQVQRIQPEPLVEPAVKEAAPPVFDPAAKVLEMLGQLAPGPDQQRDSLKLFLDSSALRRDAYRLPSAAQTKSVLFVVPAAAGDFPALARTLASVEPDLHRYNWLFAIVSDQPAPDPFFLQSEKMCWLQIYSIDDEQCLCNAIDSLVDTRTADWFCVLPVGTQLEPLIVPHLDRYVREHPLVHAVYVDHDCLDAEFRRCDPVFKPDLNLDMLRSTDYVRAAVFFRSDGLRTAGALQPLGDLKQYDLLLRYLDSFGASAIGHIHDILMSLPGAHARPSTASDSLKLAVETHLSRLGINAAVLATDFPGTCRVAYHPANPELVSIIIASSGDRASLERCIESVFAQTSHPDFELVIVAMQGERPDTSLYLQVLPKRYGSRVRVIHAKGSSRAGAINLGVSMAHGEFVLLLPEECEIVSRDWITHLLNYGRRADVSAAGARLLLPGAPLLHDAGLMLGGGADLDVTSPYFRREMATAAGPFNRYQLAQNVSALSADCLLIRKHDYEAVGGLDEIGLPSSCYEIDLCLKLTARARLLVWTPYAIAVRHALLSRDEMLKKLPSKERTSETAQREKVVKRWIRQLARDPYLNRNLSLINSKALQPDLDFPRHWPDEVDGRPRIAALCVRGGGEYRVHQPLRSLRQAGLAYTSVYSPRSERMPTTVELARLAPEVLLIRNAGGESCAEALSHYSKFLPELKKVLSIDDLLCNAPHDIDLFSHYQHHWNDARSKLRQISGYIDRVVVGNEIQADRVRGIFSDVHIVADRLDQSLWGSLVRQRAFGRRPRIGWLGGFCHPDDLALIEELIDATTAKADWYCLGSSPAELASRFLAVAPGVLSPADYPQWLSALELDLTVAPLAAHPLNDVATDVRLREMASLGRAVICSDHPAYDAVPAHKVAYQADAWIAAITERIHDLDAADREGSQLHNWVLDNGWAEDLGNDWLQALMCREA
jgi:GT2 family glycosyltransferase